jgi:Protein of unknown function (DUF3237)
MTTAEIPKIELNHLFRAESGLDPKMDIGEGPYGFRRCVTISGGKFEGERLRGVILYYSITPMHLIDLDPEERTT